MHRIDTDGAAGVFDNGNPALGQLGTRLDAAYYQAVQEALCRAIELANIALVKGDNDQLYHAMVAIATGVAGGGGGGAGSVPTTRQILVGGLLQGGGDLTADRTLTLPKASPADILAGQRDDAATTPAGLKAAMGDPAGESVTFSNGRIHKDGAILGAIGPGVYAHAFAAPFPTVCRLVSLTGINQTGSAARDSWPQISSWDKNGFTYTMQSSATGGNDTLDGITWEAKGY